MRFLLLALLLTTPVLAAHDEDGELAAHAAQLVIETERALATLECEPAFGPGHYPHDESLRLQALDAMRRFRLRALRFESIAAGAIPFAPNIGLESAFDALWRSADRVEGPLYAFPTRDARLVWDREVCYRLRVIARLIGYR